MRLVISVIHQKGGVGKTTLSVCLAGELAQRGMDPLLVDADPTESESTEAVAFVTAQTEVFRPKTPPATTPSNTTPPLDPARQAFALLCQSLLSSNRFLYVE